MSSPRGTSAVGVLALVVLALAALCLFGVCGGVGVPAFISYSRRSRASEASAHLRDLYVSAAVYYEAEHVAAGPTTAVLSACTVGPATSPNTPGAAPAAVSWSAPEFQALEFAPDEPVRYQYEIAGPAGRCGHGPSESLYSFRAHGDLDEDRSLSLFELSVGTDETGTLYRTPGLYIVDELE